MDVGCDPSRKVTRSVSFLLYLTEASWDVAADGGQLRVFRPGSTEESAGSQDSDVSGSTIAMDVAPHAGTLVLFDSATLPHAVLPTRRERLCVAGWLCVH